MYDDVLALAADLDDVLPWPDVDAVGYADTDSAAYTYLDPGVRDAYAGIARIQDAIAAKHHPDAPPPVVLPLFVHLAGIWRTHRPSPIPDVGFPTGGPDVRMTPYAAQLPTPRDLAETAMAALGKVGLIGRLEWSARADEMAADQLPLSQAKRLRRTAAAKRGRAEPVHAVLTRMGQGWRELALTPPPVGWNTPVAAAPAAPTPIGRW